MMQYKNKKSESHDPDFPYFNQNLNYEKLVP